MALWRVMVMTATGNLTNQTVTINNQAKARQCGEKPSWRKWSFLVFYSKGGFVLRHGKTADAETRKRNIKYCLKVCQSFPRRKETRRSDCWGTASIVHV